MPEADRANVLDQKAREESKSSHGAFFGALLAVRHGADLPNHARLMLERLNQRTIPSGGTLRDALAFIAIMHSEGLEILSRSVLAKALGCGPSRLHRDVLAPLGQEAAATTTSSFIFTRHRRIATTLASILENTLLDDVSERFVTLAIAAIEAAQDGEHVPNLASWRYDVAEHFFDSGRKALAFEIARGVLSREPQNIMTLVSVARLYRKDELAADALDLFRNLPKTVPIDRVFLTEWAVSEADSGNYGSSALLAAFALSDDSHRKRIDTVNAIICFSVLSKGLRGLFTGYREISYRDARAAAATLALTLSLNRRDQIEFESVIEELEQQGAPLVAVQDAFEVLRQGVIAAEAVGVDDAVEFWIPDAGSLDFRGLHRLVYASLEAKTYGGGKNR